MKGVVIIAVSDAQKKATMKYRKKTYRNWQVDLKKEDWNEIENERHRLGLSRSELLKKIIKEN